MQEVAYALATAIGVLDAVRDSGKIEPTELPQVVGRICFFVNAGLRFVEETCKMRAFTALWDRICAERYGVDDPKLRRFRYGVQVNSLGLTEQQPENNVPRIVLETLGVTLSRDARARAIQLPAWNEALGLPRPWDQQWSLRIQQILAFETDLLEYDDIFDGSKVIEAKTAELAEAASAELDEVLGPGRRLRGHRGAEVAAWCAARPSGCAASSRASSRWSASTASPRRRRRRWPPGSTAAATILKVDPAVEAELRADVVALAGRPGPGARCARPSTSCARVAETGREPHAGHDRPGPRRRHHRRVGRRPCARSSASTGPRPA